MHAFPMDSNLDVMGGRMSLPESFSRLLMLFRKLTFAKGVMWGKNSLCARITLASYESAFYLSIVRSLRAGQ